MRKRYIPAFVAEGVAVAMMLYNFAEILITGDAFMVRPAVWVFGVITTIATAPAFIMWMLERRR